MNKPRFAKATVGDVEILYIPTRGLVVPHGEIFSRMCNLADGATHHHLGYAKGEAPEDVDNHRNGYSK